MISKDGSCGQYASASYWQAVLLSGTIIRHHHISFSITSISTVLPLLCFLLSLGWVGLFFYISWVVTSTGTVWQFFSSFLYILALHRLLLNTNIMCGSFVLSPSSVKLRVLCREGCEGGQLISDWSKMQDGRWKAVFGLDNNSRWQLSL